MRLIGIEEHFLTDEVRAAWDATGLAAADPSAALHAGTLEERLCDLGDARLALMDESGVDVQVLSLTTPALHNAGPEGVVLARRTNDAVAEVVARRADRFQALATLPIAAPDAAALELERCVRVLGFKGAMLCGRVGTRNLDHPDFLPVFECAERLGAPILIHPQIPSRDVRNAYYAGFSPAVELGLATYGIGWHYEAGIQFVRLLLAGLFDRLPRLQLILGHWGEMVLFYAERIEALDRVAGLAKPISRCLRENLYITASGMFLPHYLERAAAIVGTERLLFSTDFPYQYRPGGEARRFLETCGLDRPAQAQFACGNWDRLTSGLG